jgi:esterase
MVQVSEICKRFGIVRGMERRTFSRDRLRFSYLDSEGSGPALIALHAHIMEAVTFTPLIPLLTPQWRVIALDQRGHGHTDHAPTYTRVDYLHDLEALFDHLHLDQAVLLGNSLGGINAYQFSAHHPEKVRGLIIEDIGAVIVDEPSFVLAWEGEFPTRDALAERIGSRFVPYLVDSFRQTPTGWKLAFEPREIVESGRCSAGDHWDDWLATDCPALLLRGRDSRVTTQAECEQMAARRPNTRLETIDGSHILHFDNPTAFNNAVKAFLQDL